MPGPDDLDVLPQGEREDATLLWTLEQTPLEPIVSGRGIDHERVTELGQRIAAVQGKIP
ncbi:MAG: hypothetical protein Greene041619_283 [Candidatus Peregrinibacteria bacterium Greene0416_19]|nr:MAG: hypothetical protein Greene041619_283 [Candidatus Peregrinibacteria bacterium Greene0416_19]